MKPTSKVAAIPTMYAGVQFRSILEAKWAAFFDELGWRWEYEPFEMDGWIPDFLIHGWTTTLVEVKPITAFDAEVAEKMLRAVEGTVWGQRSDDRHELLLVGVGLYPGACSGFGPTGLGWFPHGAGSFSGHSWPTHDTEALLGRHGAAWDYFCGSNSYHYRVSGAYDGDHHLDAAEFAEAQDVWRTASNEVQWRSPRKR